MKEQSRRVEYSLRRSTGGCSPLPCPCGLLGGGVPVVSEGWRRSSVGPLWFLLLRWTVSKVSSLLLTSLNSEVFTRYSGRFGRMPLISSSHLMIRSGVGG